MTGPNWKPILALICLAAAVVGRLAAPAFLGFAVLPLALSLILAVWAGPAQWRRLAAGLSGPAGRTRTAAGAIFILSLGLAVAVGGLHLAPAFDLNPDRTLSLTPETTRLLARLNRPVSLTVHLGPQNPRLARVRELIRLYEQAGGGHLSVNYLNPQTEAAPGQNGPRLAAPDSALIAAEGFRENISPVNEETLTGALIRLLHPENRLLYFLNTFGEKMVQDTGPGGLSQWAEDLSRRRFLPLDYYWPEGAPLPPEASALILAGPKAPLGQAREALLTAYIKNGGRVMILADPLTVALSPDFWASFGLKQPDGLVIDPELNLAGTSEAFTVCRNHPAHPLTQGLTAPTVWPLAGAFLPAETQSLTEPPPITYALALSSDSSWLETDAGSFVDGLHHYQPDQDLSGPLTLAAATELPNQGRLLALADSDLAANNFRGFAGNRHFTSAAINWLLNNQTPPHNPIPQSLILNPTLARLIFWLPTLAWPLLTLSVWVLLRYRRHRDEEKGYFKV